jgi:hypothetical protein
VSELAALRRASAALEPERVLTALDRALAEWRTPDSHWRAELARRHGGFSAAVIDRGIALGVGDWTRDRLAALHGREVREPCWRPEVSAVWLAGSIPTGCFAALLPPLLAGSAVYAKASTFDPVSPQLFADSLSAADPQVGAALALGADPEALREADAVVAYGRDETIEELRAGLPAATLFVGYGHKISLAVLGPEAEIEDAAERLALDAALWDGRGCLSPSWALVLDAPPGRAEAFASALARALERAEEDLPRGPLSAAEHTALHELRARDLLGSATRVWQSTDSTAWTVTLHADVERPPPGSLRRVPVVAVADMAGLQRWCRNLAPHLSCVGHAGFGAGPGEIARQVAAAGGSRLCPLGRMQLPPIEWNHDGQGPIRPLLRLLDVESTEGRAQ